MGVIGELIVAIAEVVIALLQSLYEVIAWPFRLLARGLHKLAELIGRFAHWLNGGREPSPIARFLGWIITLVLIFVLIAFACRKISNTQIYRQAVDLIRSVLQEPQLPLVDSSSTEINGTEESSLATPSSSIVAPIEVSGTQPFYFNAFDQAPNDEWSNQSVSIAPNGESFLGEFDNQKVSLKLDELPVHDQVELSFDLYIIRSWDGNGPEGPDIWNLKVDGEQTLLNTTFIALSASSRSQAYPDSYPGGVNPPTTGASAVNALGYDFRGTPWDAIYELNFIFAQSEDSLQLDFSAEGLQGLSDESWGIDNVKLDFLSLSDTQTSPPMQSPLSGFDNALDLDGVDDYVSLPALNLNSNMVTIEAWIKPDGFQNEWAGIVSSRAESTTAGLLILTDNEVRYIWNGDQYQWSSEAYAPPDVWSHVALVIEPSKATIYLNGVAHINNTNHLPEEFDGEARVGHDTASENRYFNGAFDDVKIWNTARSQEQIMSDMQMRLDGSEPGLIAYYPFDEGAPGSNNSNVITAHDMTGNHTGSLINFTLEGSGSNWIASDTVE